MSDTLLVFRRQLRLSLRNPAWVIIGLIQPILYLAFFGPLLKAVASKGMLGGAQAHDPWAFFVPGLLIQLGLFGAAFVGFTIIADWRAGVIERFRVTPVSRTALLAGRVLRDVLTLTVQAIVLVLVNIAFGMRAPVLGVLIGPSASSRWSRRPLSAVSPRPRPACSRRGRAGAALLNMSHGPADVAVGDHAADDAGPGGCATPQRGNAVRLHHPRHAPSLRRALLQRWWRRASPCPVGLAAPASGWPAGPS
jgi:hypothetical protein